MLRAARAFSSIAPRSGTNAIPLSPLSFLERSTLLYPDSTALVYGSTAESYTTYGEHCRLLASSLTRLGVKRGDVVSLLCPNTPPSFYSMHGVPGAGACLHSLNTRLDPATIAYQLEHSRSKVFIFDRETASVCEKAIELLPANARPVLVGIDEGGDAAEEGMMSGDMTFHELLQGGDPEFELMQPLDEYDSIALNYTSGTTGNPKGVLLHHRGAWLNAIGNAMQWGLPARPVFLSVVPTFHCNGWCLPWAVVAQGGANVCLRHAKGGAILSAIREAGVSHLSGAPIIMGLMLQESAAAKALARETIMSSSGGVVSMMTAGSAPPPSVVQRLREELAIKATAAYGLTEVYGPVTACEWDEAWDELPDLDQHRRIPWQVPNIGIEECRVIDGASMQPVAADGHTIGEIMMRGNAVMKGYLRNEAATEEAFSGGYFRTGDLGVQHAGGRFEIVDRKKDIIISGGENIASIEVETVLHLHPAVANVAVVAIKDDHWGEVPAAAVELASDVPAPTPEELISFCRDHLAHFKAPKRVVFMALPTTSTGKITKFALRAMLQADGDA